MTTDRQRLTLAILLSLLIHAPLLSLTFGDQAAGLPGFSFSWPTRRVEAPDLRAVLLPAQGVAAEPPGPSVQERLQQALLEQTVEGGLTTKPSVSLAAIPIQPLEPSVPPPLTTAQVEPKANIASDAAPVKASQTEPAVVAAPAPVPAPVPEVIAVAHSDDAAFVVPPPAPLPAPTVNTATPIAPITPITESVIPTPRESAELAQKRSEQASRERAAEAAKIESARIEAERQEAARLAAAKLVAQQKEAARQEAARVQAAQLAATKLEAQHQAEKLETARVEAAKQETAKQEAARLEAQQQEATRIAAARAEVERKEAARLAAAKLEAQRQELARQDAARVEAARLDAARLAAAKLESDRLDAVRQAAAQKDAARLLEEKEEDARREARRLAMGRQLNEEAARREAATTARPPGSSLPLSLSTARRVRLWGRTDPNVELVQYVEAWARKIQFNTLVDTVREIAKRPHTQPMVTVAIRSDGSVESVTFVVSSGVAEVDEGIRRIIQSHAPYQSFSPLLAREYDVVEVRRTWQFDTAVRLY